MEKINYEFTKDQLYNIVAVIEQGTSLLEEDTLIVQDFIEWYYEEVLV